MLRRGSDVAVDRLRASPRSSLARVNSAPGTKLHIIPDSGAAGARISTDVRRALDASLDADLDK